MALIEGILAYVRSWFPAPTIDDVTRKRRAPSDSYHLTSPKYRRVLSPMSTNNIDDNIFSPTFSTYRRRPSNHTISPLGGTGATSRKPIVIDDDDIITTSLSKQKKKDRKSLVENQNGAAKSSLSAATKQQSPLLNGHHDDVIFVGAGGTTSGQGKFEKRNDGHSRRQSGSASNNVTYITKFTQNREPVTVKLSSMLHNGSSSKSKMAPKISPILRTPLSKPKRLQSHLGGSGSSGLIRSPSLDYTRQLEDREKYKELLEKTVMHGSFNNSNSIYCTPVGQLYNYDISKRTRNIVERARPADLKPVEIVDLTNDTGSGGGGGGGSKSTPRLSTKDTVKKVLDDFATSEAAAAAAVIEDSDSDVEVLPTPPSPKPDIKVDPVNSLKTVIDTSEATHPKWLDDISQKHDRYLENKEREIKAYTDNSSALNEINRDLLFKSLTKKIEESLSIRDQILPVEDEEEEEEEEIELPKLTDEHLRSVKRAFSGDPNEVLSKKFNLNVTRRDLQTLAGLNWLNDNVINFYMNLLIERGNSESGRWPKTYAMNTFFYQKLISSGPESLKRWTRRVDIFAHRFVCVPIHLGMHWCMAIVDLKGRTIKYYDSMGKDNNQCLKALRNYLEFEHKDKKGGQPFDTSDFTLENVQDIPQQMNGSDCGMFSCTFAEFVTRKARLTFDQSDMPYLRKKMVWEILSGQLMIQ